MNQSRKNSYVHVRIGEIEFDIDDWVYLKISPLKDMMRFKKKGTLVLGMWVHIKILRHI